MTTYYIYKIVWQSGHFYIGQCSAHVRLGLTPEQDIAYTGSPKGGVAAKFAELTKQFGLPTKHILHKTDCLEQLYELEHKLITRCWANLASFAKEFCQIAYLRTLCEEG